MVRALLMMSFSLHPMRRLIMSVCPIMSDTKLIHSIKVTSPKFSTNRYSPSSEMVRNLWDAILALWSLFHNHLPSGAFSSHWWCLPASALHVKTWNGDFPTLSCCDTTGWSSSTKTGSTHHLFFWASGFLLFIQCYNLLLTLFFVMHKLSSFGQQSLQAGVTVLLICPRQSLSMSLLLAQDIPAHFVLSLP